MTEPIETIENADVRFRGREPAFDTTVELYDSFVCVERDSGYYWYSWDSVVHVKQSK